MEVNHTESKPEEHHHCTQLDRPPGAGEATGEGVHRVPTDRQTFSALDKVSRECILQNAEPRSQGGHTTIRLQKCGRKAF